jgi:hypothetical protein
MKTTRKHLKIEVCGLNDSDLEIALQEIQRIIAAGLTSGFDSNDTGSYSFDVTRRPHIPWAGWFKGRTAIRDLPGDCIEDCSAPEVDASETVDLWVKMLQFEAPPWLLREFLRGTGAYEPSQLCDHQANLRRLLWIWANDCRANGPDNTMYLAR